MTDSKDLKGRGEMQPAKAEEGHAPLSNPKPADTQRASELGEADDGQRWSLLQELLTGPQEERLVRLEEEPPVPTKLAISLPEAVAEAAQEDSGLAEALAPTIEQGLLHSARKNPEELAEAIHPVLGPAIRRSIRAALQSSLQSLNVALENSFSPKGLRWRMEAWRTGKPFGEVVLLHSLEYRVEQVFWIERESGVLLASATRDGEEKTDPDLVSGMLAAIQDFIRDSFEGAGDGGELEQIEVSGYRVLLAQGQRAGLAAMVRGIPPEELAEEMRATVETLNGRFGNELAQFDGDTKPLAGADAEIAGLLSEQTKSRGKSGIALPVILGLATLLVLWWLVSWVKQSRLESLRETALEKLVDEPGYWMQGGPEQTRWSGLQDPLARPLQAVLGHDPGDLDVAWQWQSFQSLEPSMVLKRAQRVLEPPDNVTLSLRGTTLVIAGESGGVWRRRALTLAPTFAGAGGVDHNGLVDVDRRDIVKRTESLDGLYLPFGIRSKVLDRARPEVKARLAAIAALDRDVSEQGGSLRLELLSVLGADEEFDRALAQARVAEVRTALATLGLVCTTVEALTEPSDNSARIDRPGVRLGIRTILPKVQ